MKPLKTLFVFVFSILLLSACATTNERASSGDRANNTHSYYGKWTLVKIVLENGEVKDFTNAPANYVHIKETEITEDMPGYGIKNYNYIEKDNTLIIMAGNRLSTWKIVKQTPNTLEIQTAAGRYVLTRPELQNKQ